MTGGRSQDRVAGDSFRPRDPRRASPATDRGRIRLLSWERARLDCCYSTPGSTSEHPSLADTDRRGERTVCCAGTDPQDSGRAGGGDARPPTPWGLSDFLEILLEISLSWEIGVSGNFQGNKPVSQSARPRASPRRPRHRFPDARGRSDPLRQGNLSQTGASDPSRTSVPLSRAPEVPLWARGNRGL